MIFCREEAQSCFEFRDLAQLYRVVRTYPDLRGRSATGRRARRLPRTFPHSPGALCAGPPGGLFFEDCVGGSMPSIISCVDLEHRAFCLRDDVPCIDTGVKQVLDMCYVRHVEMLVATLAGVGVRAYDVKTGSVVWEQTTWWFRKLHYAGVTSDGCGHVYVCDAKRKCVLKFTDTGRSVPVELGPGEFCGMWTLFAGKAAGGGGSFANL